MAAKGKGKEVINIGGVRPRILPRYKPPGPSLGWYRLMTAIKKNDEIKVRDLVAKGDDINEMDQNRVTPLGVAIEIQSLSMVKLLLILGSNLIFDKENIKNFLFNNKNLDDPALLFCLEFVATHFSDEIRIQNKIREVKQCQEEIWKNTKKIIEESTSIASDVMDIIIKGYDSPLNRLSVFCEDKNPISSQPTESEIKPNCSIM